MSGPAAAPVAIDDLKANLKALASQREAIEAEITERTARLNAPGQPGLTGSLLDKQGFPRSDIDVLAVRTDRNRVICLSNDHKVLTDRIHKLLDQLHEKQRLQQGSPAPPALAPAPGSTFPAAAASTTSAAAPTTTEAAAPTQPTVPQAVESASDTTGAQTDASASGPAGSSGGALLRPFALVDEVSPDSPASTAGIQVGDQLCRFGDVSYSSGGELPRVAQVLQASQGRSVEAVLLRQGQPLALSLTPRTWSGRGLLGCHLRPL